MTTHEPDALGIFPATRHHYRPVGFGVERVEVNENEVWFHINLLLTPHEAVIVEINEKDKPALIQALQGGIVTATAADIPAV